MLLLQMQYLYPPLIFLSFLYFWKYCFQDSINLASHNENNVSNEVVELEIFQSSNLALLHESFPIFRNLKRIFKFKFSLFLAILDDMIKIMF